MRCKLSFLLNYRLTSFSKVSIDSICLKGILELGVYVSFPLVGSLKDPKCQEMPLTFFDIPTASSP